ncbi:MAG: methyltransferase domain-containing protein [Nitrospirota bacterium]
MLNPAFPQEGDESQLSNYVLAKDLARRAFDENSSLCNGAELRLQSVYQDELWRKLKALNLANLNWSKLNVLDVCCGTGLLSFHLLSRVRPANLMLLDASQDELEESKALLHSRYPGVEAMFVKADMMESGLMSSSFDVIIGNSFLHHLYDMPRAASELKRLLKPGGVFATLHEPTPAAIAYESASWNLVSQYWSEGPRYVEKLRRPKTADHGCGADIWLLEPQKIQHVFTEAGFGRILVEGWHILRPIVVAAMKLHLHQCKPALTLWEQSMLRFAVSADSVMRGFLPLSAFGSLSLSAQKPLS